MDSTNEQDPAAPETGPQFFRIPLWAKDGTIRDYATVDPEDAHLAGHRWYMNNSGYAVRNEPIAGGKQRTVLMSRVILDLPHGDERECDHISRDKLDNRRCNLRIVTHAENMQNREYKHGVSQYRGVSKRKDKRKKPWTASLKKDGKSIHLGFYATEEEAAAVAAKARGELLPFAVESAA